MRNPAYFKKEIRQYCKGCRANEIIMGFTIGSDRYNNAMQMVQRGFLVKGHTTDEGKRQIQWFGPAKDMVHLGEQGNKMKY